MCLVLLSFVINSIEEVCLKLFNVDRKTSSWSNNNGAKVFPVTYMTSGLFTVREAHHILYSNSFRGKLAVHMLVGNSGIQFGQIVIIYCKLLPRTNLSLSMSVCFLTKLFMKVVSSWLYSLILVSDWRTQSRASAFDSKSWQLVGFYRSDPHSVWSSEVWGAAYCQAYIFREQTGVWITRLIE